MKVLLLFLSMISVTYAQEIKNYLRNFENKTYSLKSKGVKDFVVDLENPKLTKQVNDMQRYGKVEKLIFRVYWTSVPERISVEVIGLPDGFKEFREELIANLSPLLEYLTPISLLDKFKGYELAGNSTIKNIRLKDKSGIASVPEFQLMFDQQDRLSEIKGLMPVGVLEIRPIFEKTNFSDGKWVLKSEAVTSLQGGTSLKVLKEFNYSKVDGISVLSEIVITTERQNSQQKTSPHSFTDEFQLKNYKINNAEALKYFLGREEFRKKSD